jgi:hypothetical protein
MNERIKELAKQADINLDESFGWWIAYDLERFAELVRQDERKACADLAYNCDPRANHRGIAAAIRGRTE